MRTVMRQTKRLLGLGFIFFFAATVGRAQMPAPAAPAQEQGAPPAVGQWQITNDGPGRPLLGKITTINKGSLELAKPDGTTDRKSTCLNSSHLGISYAVFCLKKKT